MKALLVSGDGVLQDLHRDGGAGLPRREAECSRCLGDTEAVAGEVVVDAVIDGCGHERGRGRDHVHPDVDGTGAFADGGARVAESQHRQGVRVANGDGPRRVRAVDLIGVVSQQLDRELRITVVAVVAVGNVARGDVRVPGGNDVDLGSKDRIVHGIAVLRVVHPHPEGFPGVPVVEDPVVEEIPLVDVAPVGLHPHDVGVVVHYGAGHGGRARRYPEFGSPGLERRLVVVVRSLVAVVGLAVPEGQQ